MPTTALETILAFGVNPNSLIAFSEANKLTAAPSFNPEAFPAVTVPSFLKTVLNFDKPSKVVSFFGNSSLSKIKSSPFL